VIFEHIVSKANDIVLVAEIPETGRNFKIIYTNEALTRVFGYTAEEAQGQSPRILQGPDTDAATVAEISAAVHQGISVRRRLLNYSKSGERVWVEVNIVPLPNAEGRTTHFAAIERDVTADVEREVALEELSLRDPLTRVGNRRAFEATLAREIAAAKAAGGDLAVALFDLDHFKSVNDVHGHQGGDLVLVAFAAILLEGARRVDSVARIGGEEFAVVLPGADVASAKSLVERMCARLRARPLEVGDGKTRVVTTSAGVTGLQMGDETRDQLMARADRALYDAKAAGRDRVVAIEATAAPSHGQAGLALAS